MTLRVGLARNGEPCASPWISGSTPRTSTLRTDAPTWSSTAPAAVGSRKSTPMWVCRVRKTAGPALDDLLRDARRRRFDVVLSPATAHRWLSHKPSSIPARKPAKHATSESSTRGTPCLILQMIAGTRSVQSQDRIR